jgi:O-antigen ligase
MSLRVLFGIAYVIFFSYRAWKGKWYESLCAAIIMMAVMQHPDMPKSLGGIQGMNLWNLLIINVLLAWHRWRRIEGLRGDLPRYFNILLFLYCMVIAVSFVRMFFDRTEYLADETTGSLLSEYIINCYKWIIPCLLLYDGCRTRRRFYLALATILGMYFLLALQVIKSVPISSVMASGEELSLRASKQCENNIGYNRVNLSMMLSGASWAVLSVIPLLKKNRYKIVVLAVTAAIALGQALTGGRTGYVTWGLVGVIICVLRWRKFLPIIPITVILVVSFVPSVKDRMLMGVGAKSGLPGEQNDQYTMTSGRNIIWPFVIAKIKERPVFGYGRLAMNRTGLSTYIWNEYMESFPHPHNAYFEWMFDNGVTGLLLILPFYFTILFQSVKLLLVKDNMLYTAVGGVCLTLVLALLLAAFGSQTFYPREGSVGMWAAIGLMLRASRFLKEKNGSGNDPLKEELSSPPAVPAGAA